jgi:hypothetical protein
MVRSSGVGRYTNPVSSLVKICTMWLSPPLTCCVGWRSFGQGPQLLTWGRCPRLHNSNFLLGVVKRGIQIQNYWRGRIQIWNKLFWIHKLGSASQTGIRVSSFHFNEDVDSLRQSDEILRQPSVAPIWAFKKLLNFDLNADSDSAFHSNADPDTQPWNTRSWVGNVCADEKCSVWCAEWDSAVNRIPDTEKCAE